MASLLRKLQNECLVATPVPGADNAANILAHAAADIWRLSITDVTPSLYAREACPPAYKVFVAPSTETYSRCTTTDQKWRYEALCLIAETLTGEGCTAVDARKRAKVVFAGLRDGAEPGSCPF
jgi:hypothetical protein